MDVFQEGMIRRIYCEDFLTYNSIECYPCAKLNMIVGPNGTGKSSLVNAIVLGLGGKTNVIGRSKQLGAYVKRGCKTAKIEIELYSEPSCYTIGREFNIENKNSWTINNESVSLRQVETLIRRLNIQVDNLCQFLPQDKVQDFAKMNSKELLENTLKTVGSNKIVTLHDSLKELREKEIGLEAQTKSKKQQLDSERKKIARLETEVKAIQEREEMLKSVKIVEKKKAWVECSEKENHKKGVLEDRKKIINMKEEAEKKLLPFEKQIQETKDQIKEIDKNINKEIKICGDKSSAVRRKLGDVEDADDEIHSIKNELKQRLEAEERRSQKIRNLEMEIRKLEVGVNPEKETRLAQQVNEIHPKLSEKNNEVTAVQAKAQEVEDNVAEATRTKVRMEAALGREMSAVNKKKQILSQRFPDAFRAYEWLQENRHQFQHQIYGPIMLEINCTDEVAKFVEFILPQRDLIAFVCEDRNDMTKMLKTVRDQMGLRINVVQATKNFNNPVKENYHPNISLQAIKNFGFWSYIIDEIDGPNPVLNYLCHNYRLQSIPLGNKQTNSMVDKIPDVIQNYFSDSHHFSVRVSKYSREKSSRIVSVRDSFLLSGSTNTALIAEYRRGIQKESEKLNLMMENLNQLKSQTTSIERETNELRSMKRTLDQELMNLRQGRSKLKMRKEELDIMTREGAVNAEAERSTAKERISRVIIKVCSERKNIVSFLRSYQDSLCKNLVSKLKLSKIQDVLKKKQQESMEATKKLEDCKRLLVNVEDDLKQVQKEYKKAFENALKHTEGLNPKDPAFKKQYEQPFASLPDDIDSLDAELSRLSARADCLAGGRMSVLEEYDKTKKLIQSLEAAVANPEQQLQLLQDEMEEKRNIWIPQVSELITQINNNFTTFFSLMKCVGEVSLEEPPDKNEYSKYGICIKVQFRESGKLQQLGPHTQSGGERAVATAIYMLSLQELTTVPFRCVDEINQGMDEHNERVVFSLMVSTVEKANSAQCFLLTPKILNSLEYSDYVKILCIYSGPSSISHQEFKADKYLHKINRRSQKMMRNSLKRKHIDSDSD